MTTTPDFFTPDAELKAENLELKREIDNLKAEIEAHIGIKHGFAQTAAEDAERIAEAERRGFEAAREMFERITNSGIRIDSAYRWVTFDDYQRSKSQEGQS